MTFIQPNKNNSFLNTIIALLAGGLVLGIFGMVVLYNVTVSMSHDIDRAKAEISKVGAANTEINNKIVALFGGNALTKFAGEHGLVTESKPQYFSLNQNSNKWPIASQ